MIMRKELVNLVCFLTIVIFTGITNTACKKSGDPIVDSSYFKWTFEGQNYTANIDTSYLTTLHTWMIYAGNGQTMHTLTREVAFSLTSINTGTYSLAPGNGNYFGYLNDAAVFFPVISGTIEITNNTNNVISGSFSATVGNVTTGIKSISGSFNNFVVKP
jgi:hypothetical protein